MLSASFFTVTLHLAFNPLYVFAVIVAVPVPTAVIFPLLSTVATLRSLVVKATSAKYRRFQQS